MDFTLKTNPLMHQRSQAISIFLSLKTIVPVSHGINKV